MHVNGTRGDLHARRCLKTSSHNMVPCSRCQKNTRRTPPCAAEGCASSKAWYGECVSVSACEPSNIPTLIMLKAIHRRAPRMGRQAQGGGCSQREWSGGAHARLSRVMRESRSTIPWQPYSHLDVGNDLTIVKDEAGGATALNHG
jgi:hypothetical protein